MRSAPGALANSPLTLSPPPVSPAPLSHCIIIYIARREHNHQITMKLNSHIRILPEAEEGRQKKMGPLSDHLREDLGEGEEEDATPKLSLFSLPKKPPELPGMVTPPLQTAVSVPFQWEEAPGRPRPSCTRDSKPPSAR